MEFVLDHGIEILGGLRISIVIGAAFRIDVRDLLPDAAFAGADGTHAFEQLV